MIVSGSHCARLYIMTEVNLAHTHLSPVPRKPPSSTRTLHIIASKQSQQHGDHCADSCTRERSLKFTQGKEEYQTQTRASIWIECQTFFLKKLCSSFCMAEWCSAWPRPNTHCTRRCRTKPSNSHEQKLLPMDITIRSAYGVRLDTFRSRVGLKPTPASTRQVDKIKCH